MENASYGLTTCAESNAAFHAVAEGCKRFVAVAVSTPLAVPGSPCGACRQLLAELGPRLEFLPVGTGAKVVRTRLDLLLPRAFRFAHAGEQPVRRPRVRGLIGTRLTPAVARAQFAPVTAIRAALGTIHPSRPGIQPASA